jgi:hypothetical protein
MKWLISGKLYFVYIVSFGTSKIAIIFSAWRETVADIWAGGKGDNRAP